MRLIEVTHHPRAILLGRSMERTNADISQRLVLLLGTVEQELTALRVRLGGATDVQVIVQAVREALI